MEAMEYIKRKATKHPGLAALGSVAVVLPFFMGPGADTVPPEVENLRLEHHVQTCSQAEQRAFFLGTLKAADLIPNHNRDSQSALKDHILLAINGLIAQSEIPTTGPDALHSYKIPAGYTVNVLSRTPPQNSRDDDVNRIFEAQVIEESYYEEQRCQLAALAINIVIGENGQTITEFTAPDLFGETRKDELMRITPDTALPIKESNLDPANVAQTLVYAGTLAELTSGIKPIINPDLNPATSAAPSY